MPEPMIARVRIIGASAACVAALLSSSAAHAQRPVCPAPSPDQVYYKVCNAGGQFAAARFLSDFAIDHLFHGAESLPFLRRPFEILREFDAGWVINDEQPLATYLKHLKPIQFTRLDTATGNVRWDVDEQDRNFSATVAIFMRSYDLSWQLPAQVAGGYWRTPGVLQVAFWEEQRPLFSFNSPDGPQLRSEISCAVFDADGLRLVTTDVDMPNILVRFDPCP